ncbi:hypothetical protein DI392_03375 [Vibrio albus]|uniref:DUF2799 domain-containing protein n=1 Tax=Vibrio albus TaxID=2200953 RepID=A0A2U3BEV6_9VIBR|nr:DUF2799 domain-containing protein [Vibrio albus]PWI35315.1 hypothetical protein DI392_03375 [Vibrio albus]
MKKLGAVLLAAIVLSGCSKGISDLAAENDWYGIGYQDGIKGSHARSYSQLRELGQANHAEYDQGYMRGVAEYCDPDVAYQIGLSGQYYEGVCEGTEHAQKFRMEWQRGWNESR